jgi:DNA-binding NarL/FixJ family response regulator
MSKKIQSSLSDTRPVSTRQVAILWRLLTGATQDTIARELKLSLRTIENDVAELRRKLSARTRYTLGAASVRWGYVAAAAIRELVRERAGIRNWQPPTRRQHVIIIRMSGGRSYAQLAEELGVSVRTVRRDLQQLITANGAVDLVTAGALFEALGWHRDTPQSPLGHFLVDGGSASAG